LKLLSILIRSVRLVLLLEFLIHESTDINLNYRNLLQSGTLKFASVKQAFTAALFASHYLSWGHIVMFPNQYNHALGPLYIKWTREQYRNTNQWRRKSICSCEAYAGVSIDRINHACGLCKFVMFSICHADTGQSDRNKFTRVEPLIHARCHITLTKLISKCIIGIYRPRFTCVM